MELSQPLSPGASYFLVGGDAYDHATFGRYLGVSRVDRKHIFEVSEQAYETRISFDPQGKVFQEWVRVEDVKVPLAISHPIRKIYMGSPVNPLTFKPIGSTDGVVSLIAAVNIEKHLEGHAHSPTDKFCVLIS